MQKHSITTPDGKRHTRNSKGHTYTHAVVLSPAKAGHVARIRRDEQASAEKQFARYTAVAEAAERGVEFEVKAQRLSASYTRRTVTLLGEVVTVWAVNYGEDAIREDAHEVVAKTFRELAASAERSAKEAQAKADALSVMDPDTEIGEWTVAGWRSRADLARSLATGSHLVATSARYGKEIVVMEAEQVG